ncbi:mitogen-activated protein kinase-binding protein 1-like [Paramisgurnus dabryanus]|uniref:mitogen-activated protein kinase-binding protein 1-like n=1 Tax=Paramisgurnus dabryanus TaxID=90735 RepID=UPI003CCFD4E9
MCDDMEGFTIKSRIKNLLRSPSIKLGKNRCRVTDSLSSQVTLERVLGITASGNSSLTCDPWSGTVAYPAGCVVVLLNPSKTRQEHLISSSRKTITALSFSSDGKYLVTGECGYLPAVRVWDVEGRTQVAELQEHKYGVSCVTFSPDSKYIVSVGSQHDMSVNVWLWKRNSLVATNKVSSKVTAVAFSDDSSYFVTAGNRHVRFWYLESSLLNKFSSTVPLMGRSGLLGDLQNNFFCDVACGHGQKSESTFCVTSSGLLCEFNSRRILEKWVDLKTTSAASLSVTEDLIFCACANGTVRVFSPSDLNFVCTLPRPHHPGVAVSQTRKPGPQYPDSVAVTYDPVNRWLSCVYSDHSLYVWDTRDLQKVGKVYFALYHSAYIRDLQMFPTDTDDSKAVPGSSGLFLSCSADGTVRMWSLESVSSSSLLSNDLHKIIYTDDTLLDIEGTAVSSSEKSEGESRNSISTICVSPDARHLASGDRNGTLRVHELTCMKEILKADVHESEIRCLEYSKPHTGMNLLVTASRDVLIHVLDVDKGYSLIQTLDHHTSCVTAVHFTVSDGEVKLISCGSDKSLYFHTAHKTVRGTKFVQTHHVLLKTTSCDMTVDPNGRYTAVSCQDRSIRVFNISSGKQKRSYKGSDRDDGSLLNIPIEMDPSGVYVATSCSDKSISLFDFMTGECLASMFGHSDVISSLMFTDDCRHLISASGDSCIIVWRLSPELTMNMRERLCRLKRGHTVKNPPFRRLSGFTLNASPSTVSCYSEDEEDDEEYKGHQNSSQLLSEDSVKEETGASVEGSQCSAVKGSSAVCRLSEVPPRPRRRWSCRMGSLELMVKSMLELRQLDSLSKAQNRGRIERLGVEERGSTFSLQDWSKTHRVRPRSAWLAPASTPEPEGVVVYAEDWPSLSESSSELQASAAEGKPQDCRSSSSGFCSGESSPDQDHSEGNEKISVSFMCRSSTLLVPKTLNPDPTIRPQTTCSGNSSEDVGDVKPHERDPLMWSSPQRSHPYLSRVLQKSASVQNLPTDARKSLTPTRLRREVYSPLSKLKMEKTDSSHRFCPTTPPRPQSWESPNAKQISRARSYMSPTTSSIAKIARSVSVGDGLCSDVTSRETLPSTLPFSPLRERDPFPSRSTTVSCESEHLPSKAVKPRSCRRTIGSFAEWPSRSSPAHDSHYFHKDSPAAEDLHVGANVDHVSAGTIRPLSSAGDPETVNRNETFSRDDRPRAAVKAFSVTSDAPDVQASVSLEECRRAAAELCSSVQKTTRLYRTLISDSTESCVQQQQQQQVLWDALLRVGSELDSVRASGPVMVGEGKMTVALLEQYSQLLLQSVEKKLHQNM